MNLKIQLTTTLLLLAATATIPVAQAQSDSDPTVARVAHPSKSSVSAVSQRTIFSDDFSSGYSTGPGGRWQALSIIPGFPQGDGIGTTSPGGLKLVPTGKNPVTGAPAFAATVPLVTDGGPPYLDHGKYLALPNHVSSAGVPGFDVPADGSLTCTSRMAVKTSSTDQNPFGKKQVPDPQSDMRLATGGALNTDLETLLDLNFFATNTQIYAYYGRVRIPGATYAAFAYAVPVAKRTPGEVDTYQVTVDRQRTRATWELNGRTVLSVTRIGTRALDRKYMVFDNAGTDELVKPRQLTCGIATLSMLDYTSPGGSIGLSRLTTEPGRYFSPQVGAPTPETFVDDKGLLKNHLWGQGVELDIKDVQVTATN